MASVRVERTGDGFVARNDRGAEVALGGPDDDGVFSPVELLLAALGGCELVTVEPLTAKRGHRLVRLAATVEAATPYSSTSSQPIIQAKISPRVP